MGFFGAIKKPTKTILNQIFADQELSSVVTYRKFTGQTFDDSVGYNVDTFDESSITVVELKHGQESVFVQVGEVQVGDVLFLFKFDDFPLGYSLKDQIQDSTGNLYNLKKITPIFELAVVVTVDGG